MGVRAIVRMATFMSLFRLLAVLLAIGTAQAVDLHVDPQGEDTNPGTEAEPLATLAAARDAARKFAGRQAVTVHVADGVYHLPEPIVFTPEDSGTEKFPVVYRARHEGRAVLSGGSELALEWKPFRDGVYRAETPGGLEIDQLFINGEAQRMARYPDYDSAKKTDA
jgi:hypothetical protein